ncbi:MAG: hypothetical protein ABSH44_04420 [Bryobacteraceae bacterium]|jgi:hypothetical protein
MASTTQDELYETFVAVSGQPASNLDEALDSSQEMAASLSDVAEQIVKLTGSSEAQAESGSSSIPTASATSSGGPTAESIVSTVLESGFGVVPLIAGLLGLFGGGGTPAPSPLVKYAMPAPIDFESADTGSDMSAADYDQMGMPRVYTAAPQRTSTQASGAAAPDSTGGGVPSGPGGAPAPQITVNVQAMDSQSFLDHSREIAQAVRDAMLNLNSINDVVNDL